MDVLFDLVIGFGVIGGGYYWVKTKLLKPEIPRDIEIFPSRGVPLVNRVREQQAVAETEPADIASIEQVEQVESRSPKLTQPVESVIEPVAIRPKQAETAVAPEDSVLKRHYWAQRAAERQAVTNPYPTDSVLRRHYESALAASLAPAKQNIEIIAAKSVDAASSVLETASPLQIETPQDSVLKRHYQQLVASKLAETLA